MNTQVNQVETAVPEQVALATHEQRTDVVHDKLQAIQSNQIRDLLTRQNKLIKRIEALAELPDMAAAEKQASILAAELGSVRTELAKRQEDVGALANGLLALYDELGLASQKAGQETMEDLAKRVTAKAALQSAMAAVAAANAQIEIKETALKEAEDAWWPLGKDAAITAAQNALDAAKNAVPVAEDRVDDAQNGIATTEEQILVDKADRVRKASLAENFSLIRDFTSNAQKALTADVEATDKRASATEKALTSALKKQRVTAAELDKLRDQLAISERDLGREEGALAEIPDQGSADYAEQKSVVVALETKVTDLKGEELKLNTTHMAMTQAVEANKSSLNGLKMQRDTSQVYLIKLSAAEKTAEVLGRNIDQMVKNATQETASDALDRVSDSMILTAVDLGIQAEVASAKNRNDAIDRHHALMRELITARDAGDKAVAGEAARYVELDEKIRAGYADQGIDLDLSHLVAATEVFAPKTEPASSGDDVTY